MRERAMTAAESIRGKRVLVTGGTGTVGQEVLRRLLSLGPEVIRVYSRDETKHFYLQEKLRQHDNVRFLIGDVRDKARLAMALEGIEIVFHLAAMKHVELCEYNPFEAIKTNIMGTQNLIEAALEEGVRRVILASSDKAVNPCNAMGASKLMAEKLIVAANHYRGRHPTVFAGIRFGNVLGSSGSVLPTFISRIRGGEPLDVTHPEMTRFVTTYEQAVDLLLTALAFAKGGEIFVRRMPVIRILDLAEVLAAELGPLYNRSDVPIRITGVRAGEKLSEELFTLEESGRTVEWGDYFIVLPQLPGGMHGLEGARPIASGTFSSGDQAPLSKEALRDLLYREQVFLRHHGMTGDMAFVPAEEPAGESSPAGAEVMS